MRLSINLATRTYLNNRQLTLCLIGIFCVLLALLSFNIWRITSTIGETDSVKGELTAIEQKASIGRQAVVPEQDYQRLLGHIRFANAVIARKSFNWVGLLDQLEVVVPDGVALTRIEPDPKSMEVKISGSTLTFSRLRMLLENMEQAKTFSDIYLLSQTGINVGEFQKGLTFSIQCKVKL